MFVKKIYPSLLKDEIDYIYVFQQDGKSQFSRHMHLPDGSFKLLMHFGDPIYKVEYGNKIVLPNFRVVGGYTNSFYLSYPIKFTIYVVVFKPAFVSTFLTQLSDISIDKNVRASEIFGNEIDDLAESVFRSSGFRQAANIIESFLLTRRNTFRSHHADRIDYSLNLIEHQSMNISEICREIGMSERNYRRLFKVQTGFTPRRMLQLKRVRKLSRLLNSHMDPMRIISQLGYYDICHLTNDFKTVTNKTPGQYIADLDEIDEVFHKAYK